MLAFTSSLVKASDRSNFQYLKHHPKQSPTSNEITVHLSAVTICILGAEVLAKTLPNRKHFDQWVIVTVPDDRETISLCTREKLTCVTLPGDRPFGLGFDNAFNKSKYVNLGIRIARRTFRRRQNAWITILDSNVYLPFDFRERLEHLESQLSPDTIYYLKGAVEVSSGEEFECWKTQEPWLSKPHRSNGSHFHLISGRHVRPYYPRSDSKSLLADDRRYRRQSGCEKIATLPFTYLQLTHNSSSSGNHSRPRADVARLSHLDQLLRPPHSLNNSDVLQIGFFDWRITARLADYFRKVVVIDVGRLTDTSDNVLEEADREFVFRRFESALSGYSNVLIVRMNPAGRGRTSNLIRIQDAVEDSHFYGAAYFDCEPLGNIVIEVLLPLLHRLERRAWVAGAHYGYPAFPVTTATIELILGPIRERSIEGGWLQPVRNLSTKHRTPEAHRRLQWASEKRPLVVCIFGDEDESQTIHLLGDMKRMCDRALCVIAVNSDPPAIRIACVLLDCCYISAAIELSRGKPDPSMRRCIRTWTQNREAVGLFLSEKFSPQERSTLLLGSANITTLRKALPMMNSGEPLSILENSHDSTLVAVTYDKSSPKWMALKRALKAQLRRGGSVGSDWLKDSFRKVGASLISISNRANLNRRGKRLKGIPSANIHVPLSSTICTAVVDADISLLSHWEQVGFSRKSPFLIFPYLSNASFPNVRIPNSRIEQHFGLVECAFAAEPYWNRAIATAAIRIETEWLIYVDPGLRALPGAHLFDLDTETNSYCSSGWTFARLNANSVRKMPRIGPPACIFRVEWLRSVVMSFIKERPSSRFEHFVYHSAKSKSNPLVRNLSSLGWES